MYVYKYRKGERAWVRARRLAWGHAPIKCSTFPAVNKSSQLDISIIEGVKTKNSSDLSLGRRPMSKSEENFVFTPLVIEILRCEEYHFFDFVTMVPFDTGFQ